MQNAATVRVLPPRTNQEIWELIRRLDAAGSWTVTDVERETNLRRNRVGDYVRGLAKSGIVIAVDTRKVASGTPAKVYSIAAQHKDQVAAPSQLDGGRDYGVHEQQALWTAMRSLAQFTFTELAFAAQTTKKVNVDTVSRYCARLLRAGYLLKLTEKRPAVYRLQPAMNTGPKAPKMVRVDLAYDPNHKTFYPKDAAADEVTP